MSVHDQSATPPCPVCGGHDTQIFISIKEMPVFCNVLCRTTAEAQAVQRGDLDLAYCSDCTHVFNASFDAALLSYTAEYENSLHFSPRFQAYADKLVDYLITTHDLRGKEILEIGAGQGDFLQMLVRRGGNRGLAFDPSYVPEGTAPENITFVQDYFGEKYAGVAADFIACRHVLEHIAEPAAFLNTVRRTVGDRADTLLFFEVPNALFTLRHGGIWDIIYEHVSYFNALSLSYAFRRHGFDVLTTTETFGSQFLTIEARPGSTGTSPAGLGGAEKARIAGDVEQFAAEYRRKVAAWRVRLAAVAARRERAVVWGSGSKGVTFINVLHESKAITHAVDISPRKQGMYVAGAGLEIVNPAQLQQLQPELIIIMNANYEREIEQQVRELGLTGEVRVV